MMSGSAMRLNSGDKPTKQVSEVRIWLGVFAAMIAMVVVSTVAGLFEGNDIASALIGTTGAALGVLLAWGGYHLVSRRPEDAFSIIYMGTLVAMSGDKHRTFAESFAGCLIISVITYSIVGMLKRSLGQARSRRSKKAAPPRSDHLLYDADVDAGRDVTCEVNIP